MKFQSDIDIDFADRKKILDIVKHVPASMLREDKLVAHNTGVYVTDIPEDPFARLASLPYEYAESRGYLKLDFLNVNLYQQVHSETHLEQLMNTAPDWTRFNTDQSFFEQRHGQMWPRKFGPSPKMMCTTSKRATLWRMHTWLW